MYSAHMPPVPPCDRQGFRRPHLLGVCSRRALRGLMGLRRGRVRDLGGARFVGRDTRLRLRRPRGYFGFFRDLVGKLRPGGLTDIRGSRPGFYIGTRGLFHIARGRRRRRGLSCETVLSCHKKDFYLGIFLARLPVLVPRLPLTLVYQIRYHPGMEAL